MQVMYTKKTVACPVSIETYEQVLEEATRRGITVSELARFYIEQGLNNPTPKELRRLYDRFSTIETALKELYAMAIVNWAQVIPESEKAVQKAALPLTADVFAKWKAQLVKTCLLNKKTGKTAYEELSQKSTDDILEPGSDEWLDYYAKQLLRNTFKADGSWTEEEEAQYRAGLKKTLSAVKKDPQKGKPQSLKKKVPAGKKAAQKSKPQGRKTGRREPSL